MSAGEPPREVEISRKLFLNDCYSLIGCDVVDFINANTDVGRVMIVCDGDALCRDRIPLPSVALAERGEIIFGRSLVFGYDPFRPDDPFTDLPKRIMKKFKTAPVLVV